MSHFPSSASSDSFCQILRDESRLWEAEGLLSPQQRETILHRYEPDRKSPVILPTQPDSAVPALPLYVRIILILAVFMIGLAAFLLISFNWKFLPGAAKLSIVGGVLTAAHAGGFQLRRTGRKVLADVAFLFTGIMFGVGIWQVGQVFHLPADFPMGFWLWAFGAFLMAMALGSTPLHLLSVALLAAWVIAAVNDFQTPSQMYFYGLVPFSALSLPVFAMLGIGSGILRQKQTITNWYVILLLFWWILQSISCCHCHTLCLPFHIAAVGLICLAASALIKTYHAAAVWGRLGICLILGGLFVPSFLNFWGELLYSHYWKYSRSSNLNEYFFVVYMFWTIAFPVIDYLILCTLFRLTNREENLWKKFRNNQVVTVLAISLFVLWLGSYFLTLLLGQYSYGGMLETNPLAVGGMLWVNVLLVMTTIWLIWTGLKLGRGDWFWSGVSFFLFWTVVRYFDLFSGFGGMLGTAGLFLICGLFMLGIIYVWATQTRRNTMKNLAGVSKTPPKTLPIPAWLNATGNSISRFWQSERNILTASILVALIQFGILGAMIANEMVPHLAGTVICVTTEPVDPRNLFRGDYVVLRYSFSSLSAIPNNNTVSHNEPSEQTVFVTMQQDGDLWKPSGISQSRPKDGIFLRGILKPHSNKIVYGIESYFVQEGTGETIENARNNQTVVVELAVAPNGKTLIKTVNVK